MDKTMTLNDATSNTLQALFSSMDKPELDESLNLLMDESLKRDWVEVFREGEINPKAKDSCEFLQKAFEEWRRLRDEINPGRFRPYNPLK